MRVLAFLALTCCAADAGAVAPGEGFDVQRYEVRLRPDYRAAALSGETRIDLRVTSGRLGELAFTPNTLRIGSATIDGRPVRVEQRPDALVFIPGRPLQRGGRLRLAVSYAGGSVRGVAFGPRSAYSNWFACDWMICTLDRPGDRADIDLFLTVPAGQMTLGPGRLRSRRLVEQGLETHHWRSERPYSSYLYSFAAGPFTVAESRVGPVHLRFLSESADAARLARLFAPTGAMLRFFQDRAGVPFPHRAYSQLHVAGSAAQEAAGFALVGEAEIAPVLGAPQEDWVIAHELAHVWWGNLIACADWSQFWLNEGLATFMTAAWKEHRWGRGAYDHEMALARRRHQRAIDAGLDAPLTFAGPYPSLGLRRAITYSKGALFLDALRAELGDALFWRGLRLYTRRHAGGVVTSRDFQRAFEEASDRDLSAIFNRWVYGAVPA